MTDSESLNLSTVIIEGKTLKPLKNILDHGKQEYSKATKKINKITLRFGHTIE